MRTDPIGCERMGREPETTVVFRRWPDGDVLALFPHVREARPGTCSSYAHVGQHGAADYVHVIRATRPAPTSDADVAALKRELEAPPYGYRLRVVTRATYRRP